MSTVIEVKNVSKMYRLGTVGSGTLTDDVKRWVAKLRGQDDPFKRIGQVNNREQAAAVSNYVWALRNIDFEVKQGDVMGIVGRNGAGKSTLLKVLSRVTGPTEGQIRAKGRIASLLEVGTGFHPELTGRENIFLNGAILGMSRHEIRSKLDEIIDFSGVERYIDTPVKRYSSGMYVRLAFAVAAHLEPEILIIDEVLAVGDIAFQKKCLGKMRDVAGHGRTVLFVSHNMQAVSTLCDWGILLHNGEMAYKGPISNVIGEYQKLISTSSFEAANTKDRSNRTSGDAIFTDFKLLNADASKDNRFSEFDDVVMKMKVRAEREVPSLGVYIMVRSAMEKTMVTNMQKGVLENVVKAGEEYELTIRMDHTLLRPGSYSLYIALGDYDCDHYYDVLDENVELPLLNIESVHDNPYLQSGLYSQDFQFEIGRT